MGLTFHHLHDLPILLLRPCTSLMQNPFDAYFDDLKILHCRGIEPRSPTWQARILPLNQQCMTLTTLLEGVLVRRTLDEAMYTYKK